MYFVYHCVGISNGFWAISFVSNCLNSNLRDVIMFGEPWGTSRQACNVVLTIYSVCERLTMNCWNTLQHCVFTGEFSEQENKFTVGMIVDKHVVVCFHNVTILNCIYWHTRVHTHLQYIHMYGNLWTSSSDVIITDAAIMAVGSSFREDFTMVLES